MSAVGLRVERLSKLYRIGERRPPYRSFRESIAGAASALVGRRKRAAPETIWALRDVSFEVASGEVVGVIGGNGAGKSTLLKILSRITEPTCGHVELRGRVGSLLEVGTGFHLELTGRENIFLNGAILGMKRAEIVRRFDEIVAFAEVERFIDTPVKHYSTGMYLRLAFAVAAHLEPEILLVDEVLAVGDAGFQQKCLGRMESVASEGRTVLFVSHNMGAVSNLCGRTIWLDHGRIEGEGESQATIGAYLESLQGRPSGEPLATSHDGSLAIIAVSTKDASGRVTNSFRPRTPLVVEVHYRASKRVDRPYLWIGIASQWGALFAANGLLDGVRPVIVPGEGRIRCTFDELPLLPQQTYTVRIGGRAPDGWTSFIQPTDVAHITVVGSARDAGFAGESAESVVGLSAPVLVSYTWELPDGTIVRGGDPVPTAEPGSQATSD